MLKEAMQYIVGQSEAQEIKLEDGRHYANKELHPVRPSLAQPFLVTSLDSLIGYVNSGRDFDPADVMILVEDPESVKVQSYLYDVWNRRTQYMQATPVLPERIPYNRWIEFEQFIPMLKSRFVPSDEVDGLCQLLGNMTKDSSIQMKDDGVTQQTTTKQGMKWGNIDVPNPIALAPYRTFLEVDQPASDFVFRIDAPRNVQSADDFNAKLILADGEAWRLIAMQRIKAYLQQGLPKTMVLG